MRHRLRLLLRLLRVMEPPRRPLDVHPAGGHVVLVDLHPLGHAGADRSSLPSSQRACEGAAGGHVQQVDGRAGDGTGASSPTLSAVGMERSRPLVYSWLGVVEDLVARCRCSQMRPAYMTITSSHIWATTPRSWVIMMIAMPSFFCRDLHQLQNLGLDGDVQRGGRLVGDEDVGLAGQRHGDHDALAHTAGELVGILLHALFRLVDVDQARAFPRPGHTPACCCGLCAAGSPRMSWLADGVGRVQGRHRVLENDRTSCCRGMLLHALFARRRPAPRPS